MAGRSGKATSSEDFFGDFDSPVVVPPPAASIGHGPRNLRAAPPPPPPPPRPPSSGGAGGTSSSYYGNTGTNTSAAAASRPKPPSGSSLRSSAAGRGLGTGANLGASSTSTSSSRPASTPSYYGGSSTPTTISGSAAPNPYASTAAATPSSQLHYGSRQQQQQQQASFASAPQPAASSASSDWYTGSSSGTTTNQWAPPPPNDTASQMHPLLSGSMNNNSGAATTAASPYAGVSGMQAPGAWTGGITPGLEGTMDINNTQMQPMMAPQATIFQPNLTKTDVPNKYNSFEDFENEPPLLEELGVNIQHIVLKTKAVVIPFRSFSKNSALMEPSMIVEDADLAGPLAFALALGAELLLSGKIHFGYIYGFGMFGCLAMTLVLNLMSPEQPVSVWTVTSILGYALLPVNLLAAVKILLVNIANLKTLCQILGFLTVVWCTLASTRLLEVGCGMTDQRYLIAYPIALLYSAFVLITIF